MEWVEPSPAKVPEAQPPALRDVKIGSIVETFRVDDHGKKYEVAATAVANRALMQINVAKLRALCESTVNAYAEAGVAPSAKDLKAIVDAVSIVENMSEMAYSDKKNGGHLANSLERLAYAVTRGVVDGQAQVTGQNHSPKARMNRLIRIGREVRGETLDIEPKK